MYREALIERQPRKPDKEKNVERGDGYCGPSLRPASEKEVHYRDDNFFEEKTKND